jgi:hypothetical protein
MSTVTDPIQATLHQHNADLFASGVVGHPPQTLVEFLARHAEAALAVSGADQTAWNGQIVEAGEGILGLAHWDGTLHLDRECILEPLRELYLRAGDPQSDAALIRYREALVTILHEQSHFLGPAGATQEAARMAFKQPGSRALEEGVAEAWSHANLDDYLLELGIDDLAPGITEVTADPSYQAFVPAVLILTADLDHRADLPPGTALHLLNRQTAEGRWPLVVDLAYTSSPLPSVVPPDLEPAIRLSLESTLRDSFADLDTLELHPRDYAAARSRTIAHQALAHLTTEIQTIHDAFAPDPPIPERLRPTPDRQHQPSTDPFHHAFAGLVPPGRPVPSPTTTSKPARTSANASPLPTERGA